MGSLSLARSVTKIIGEVHGTLGPRASRAPPILLLIANVYIFDRLNENTRRPTCQHVAVRGSVSCASRHLGAAIANSLRGGAKPATMRSESAAVCRRMSGTATISQKAA